MRPRLLCNPSLSPEYESGVGRDQACGRLSSLLLTGSLFRDVLRRVFQFLFFLDVFFGEEPLLRPVGIYGER